MSLNNNTTILQVQFDGSDTLNGGGFDSNATGKATDLAGVSGCNTSSPVVSSASYNFVAGDVGHWLFIRSGTNWTPGWYQIASVASNQATLSAAIGDGKLFLNNFPVSPITVDGCATTATPSGGAWAIDYSQKAAAAFSLTGLTTAAANAIILTASATVAMVGNLIQITGGTNFTTGIYVIQAATAGASLTVDRNCASAAGASGTAGIGGALATLGIAASISVSGGCTFQRYNSSSYTITSATPNISNGIYAPASAHRLVGYDTNRCTSNTDTNHPLNLISGISAITIIACSQTCAVRNINIDGAGLSTVIGFSSNVNADLCIAKRCTNVAFKGSAIRCLAINCSVGIAFSSASGTSFDNCAAVNCSAGGFIGESPNCFAIGCSVGFINSTNHLTNCTAYGNSSDGFKSNGNSIYRNCISYGNTGKGFNNNSTTLGRLINCAGGSNSATMATDVASFEDYEGNVTLTANPFVNSSITINTLADVLSGFALNSTAGGGPLCLAAGTPPYIDLGAVQAQSVGGGGVSGDDFGGGF